MDLAFESSSVRLLLVAWFLYIVYGVIWRLYLSPIAHFPGPRLAALTRVYEIYYDVFKNGGGQYIFKIGELHEKYGPIVRISPWELHVYDPEFHDVLYAGSGHKRDKYYYYTRAFGLDVNIFATIPHNLHRQRRSAFSKFFSKASINALEPLIQEKVDTLCQTLCGLQQTKKQVNIGAAWQCFANDVVSEYAFAKNYNYIETAANIDFSTEFQQAMVGLSNTVHVLRQAHWMIGILQTIPHWLMARVSPPMLSLFNFQRELETHIKDIMAQKNENYKNVSHPTIFHEILSSDLPPEEKTSTRLWPEGQLVVGAGTDTTAWTLTVLTYHVLANPDIRAKMIAELSPVFAANCGKPNLKDLENLPYLNGVIAEALRLSFGVSSKSARVCPDGVMKYNDWVIPAGTPTSMSSVLIHLNPTVFLEPLRFRPSRWIDPPPPSLKRPLSYYLVSFNRGTRGCLGINLAYAEMYLVTAYIFMAFPEMKLDDTTSEDVRIWGDCFTPRSSERGVKVLL